MLERGERLDWFDSPLIRALALTAAAALVAFVWRQLVIPDPIVRFRVLRHRSLQVGCLFSVGLGAALFGSIFLFPLYTQTVLGWTAWQSGLGNLPASFSTMIGMFVAGRLIQIGRPAADGHASAWSCSSAPRSACSRWTHESGWTDIFGRWSCAAWPWAACSCPCRRSRCARCRRSTCRRPRGCSTCSGTSAPASCIASLATLLGQWSDVHRVQIDERVGQLDRPVQERVEQIEGMMLGRGVDAEQSHETALRVLDRALESQAWMLSFQDGYALLALLSLLYFPLVPLLRSSYRPSG